MESEEYLSLWLLIKKELLSIWDIHLRSRLKSFYRKCWMKKKVKKNKNYKKRRNNQRVLSLRISIIRLQLSRKSTYL